MISIVVPGGADLPVSLFVAGCDSSSSVRRTKKADREVRPTGC